MKKSLKRWTTLLLTILLIGSTLVPAHASQTEEAITPRFNTNIDVTCYSTLPDSGILYVTNAYVVNDSRITRVVVTTYVEKRTLLVIWNRVDIGTPNNEWVDYGANGYFDASHSAQMPAPGTYRVITTFDVYSGSTILDSIEVKTTVDY